ncbi:MAG TPA: hypothetical protein VNZ62_18220 [Capillimicrobium sp.]|nr:hypothetical protein [Capillimicrobium sp.]
MSAPTFEVLAFRAMPVTRGVAVLELEGRFTDRAPRHLGVPCLLVERGERRLRCPPVPGPDAAAGPGGVPWRASFAIPASLVDGAGFALEVGRDLLVELPEPDLGPPEDQGERLARLAREANELRRRLDEAIARAAAAEAEAGAARAEVDRRLVEAGQEAAEALEKARAETEAVRAEAARQLEATREQSDHLLEQARAEGRLALAAERERREREVAAIREQSDRALATAREDHARAIAALRERHERELAAVREQSDRALASTREELTADDEAPTRVAPATAAARAEPPAATPAATPPAPEPVAAEPVAEIQTGPDEGVRLLSSRRRPRHRPEDEPEPETLAPGATRIGARAIASSRTGASARHRAIEPQRVAALIALVIAIAAFVIVVVLRVGPF